MTARTRASLKTDFENRDIPQEENFFDLIDSFVSLTDEDQQSLISSLTAPEIVTADLQATTATIGTLNVTNLVQGGFYFGNVSANESFVFASGGAWYENPMVFSNIHTEGFTADLSGRVTYTGVSALFDVQLLYTFNSNGSGEFEARLKKNTTSVSASHYFHNGVSLRDATLAPGAFIELANNDKVTFEVYSSSSSMNGKTWNAKTCTFRIKKVS